MKVEIWSDIMCPFCYIGKRKFEQALGQFPDREYIEITWRSFQLDPEMQSMPGTSALEYLAERKGQTIEWSRKAHASVTATAAEVGLQYNFDKAVVANSWDAHRLIQMAKAKGQNSAPPMGLRPRHPGSSPWPWPWPSSSKASWPP